ncbi:MAG: FAD-dependent oxidoreductase, partial [Comamonadaceae bacterium]
MTQFDFDLFVIGGGSGGVRAARMAGQRGARVALAECAELGGTCVNVGCVPKKLYSYAAGYAASFAEAPGYGWTLPEAPRFDWDTLKRQRAQEIKRLNGVYQKLLDGAGVTTMQGWAQLQDAHTVTVGEQRHTARHVLVATGGMPFVPDMPGRDLAVVSDAMFDLPTFPRRLLVMGGGYIGCEFASVFRGLGAEVTLVNRGAHILNGFDDDVREFLAREMGRHGIDLRMTAQVETLRREADGLVAMLSRGQQIEADTVLVATGRRPNTAGLGLEAAGVKLDSRGAIEVDAQYRSSVPSVLAIGDVSSRLALTPVALAEAMVVVDELFGDGQRHRRQRQSAADIADGQHRRHAAAVLRID